MIPRRFIGENIVHLPTVKTHVFTTTTGAMKNAFGGLLNERRHWTHPVIHETLVDLLMIQKQIHRGVFAVMDGTFAGDGPGPRCMVPHVEERDPGQRRSGGDRRGRRAADGLRPAERSSTSAWRTMPGWAAAIPRDIEIVGDDEAATENWHFVGPFKQMTFASRMQHLIYWGPLRKPIEWSLKTVLAPWAYIASVLYHDSFWYPLNAERQMKQVLASPWGRLFENWEQLTPDANGFPDVGDAAGGRHRAQACARSASRSAFWAPASKKPRVRQPPAASDAAIGGVRTSMADFNIRSESVDVEQIMKQIRARIREKRGVDYTEEQIRELATVRLEKFLDPKNLRSDLLEQFRRSRPADHRASPRPIEPPYVFDDQTLFASHRGPLRFMRKLLMPILKLFFNPNTLNQVLHTQAQFNVDMLKREAPRKIEFDRSRAEWNMLYYEVLHNLVLETTRMRHRGEEPARCGSSRCPAVWISASAASGRSKGVVQYRPEAVRPRERERRRRRRDRRAGSRQPRASVAEGRRPPMPRRRRASGRAER